MTRKSSKTTEAPSPGTSESLNELYTAHQVHTLAQLMFRHLALEGSLPRGPLGGAMPTEWPVPSGPALHWYP